MNISALFQQTYLNIKDNLTVFSGGILTVWVGLTIVGGFLLIYTNALHLSSLYFQTHHYSVFVEPDITDSSIRDLKRRISIPGVSRIQWTDSQKARDELFESFGKDAELLRNLQLNNIPAVLEFDINPDEVGPQRIQSVLSDFTEVREVLSGQEVKGQIENYFQIIRFTGLGFLSILGVAIIILVNTSIQVIQFTKIKEIEILKTIGATNWFIRFPYLVEGILQSLIGFAVSTASLYFLFKVIIAGITFNEATYSIGVNARFFTWYEFLLFLGISVFLGLVGAWMSTGKILRMLPG